MTARGVRVPIPVGTRVRHAGQQYRTAFAAGTGTVLQVLEQHSVDGTWEYLVCTDDGRIVSWNRIDVAGTEPPRAER